MATTTTIIKGSDLRVYLGAKAIACATNCSLHSSASVEDVSTKDDGGMYQLNEVTGIQWDASTEGLVALTGGASDETDVNSTIDLMRIIGQTVTISFKTKATATPTTAISGSAIVTDITINAQHKQNATYSVKFTGIGPLS